MLGILAGMDQKDSYALCPGKAVIACDNAPRAVFSSRRAVFAGRTLTQLAGFSLRPLVSGSHLFAVLLGLAAASVGGAFRIQRNAWFDSGSGR